MSPLLTSLLLSFLAGLTIPVGAHLASVEHIRPRWLENELRHGVIAFGGGVLLAAVSLVLVPEGLKTLHPVHAVAAFVIGGFVFFVVGNLITRQFGSRGQLMAMLLDFVPEAIAMGAALATGEPIGLLLALLIALQNLPEGFNAFREMRKRDLHSRSLILISFWLMSLVGPACAYLGYSYLADSPSAIGALMLFASGGIIYLTFQDIAPQSAMRRHSAPALGAVAGFSVGLIGHLLIV